MYCYCRAFLGCRTAPTSQNFFLNTRHLVQLICPSIPCCCNNLVSSGFSVLMLPWLEELDLAMPKSGTPQAFLGMLLYLTHSSSSLSVTQLLVRLSCFSKLPVAVRALVRRLSVANLHFQLSWYDQITLSSLVLFLLISRSHCVSTSRSSSVLFLLISRSLSLSTSRCSWLCFFFLPFVVLCLFLSSFVSVLRYSWVSRDVTSFA